LAKKSVLIIGGGIAGIQSSLDLANMGFQVYLVEKTPSIGGRMAQLDKIFPTNDCSTCILAPKMIEANSHPNIELLTYSEVGKISGEIGKFKVKVRRKASFVDWNKCTGCGLCVEGCPVILPNEFNQAIGTRKAIYLYFPQAVPRKYVIDKREKRPCKTACMDACPVHTNVPGYIKLIAERQFKAAYKLIRETNPLPASVGRVCYAPCQEACNRGQMDEPLCIRDLKRVPGDQWNIEELEVPVVSKTDKKVAIVGAGPAGLAAANDLALKGHNVTIFEALPEPGGMLRVGIPEFRLPKEILRQEIGYIQKLGVEIKTGVRVGKDVTLEELRKDYDAIFVGTGAHTDMKLGVEGEDIHGVMEGIGFLRAVALGEKVNVGKRVAVIGGGNTAIDCARTAKRLGAKEVTIVDRCSHAEMPASEEEVTAAEKEGVKIEFLTMPSRFSTENKKLARMECVRMKLGEPDASGRPRPIPIKGSEFTTPVDTVITALGQVPETDFVKALGVSVSQRGTIEIDDKTGATNIEGVFAGGDVVTGPAFLIDAIAGGKNAARSIHQYLMGQPLVGEEPRKEPEKLSEEEIKDLKRRFPSRNRVGMKEEAVKERVKDYCEVALGYSLEEAVEEASRCLAEQVEGCIECQECERRCEPKAIIYTMKEETITLDVDAIIIASGLDLYDISPLTEYGYGKIKNVITAMQYERMISASGPTGGHLKRPSDGATPKSLAFIQCVGSRDTRHKLYCSSVCCMHATKEAILANEHYPELKSYIFYTDMRAVGKRFREYIARAEQEYKVTYIRSRPSKITENPNNADPIVWYEETTARARTSMEVDMVVLCQALIPSGSTKEISDMLHLSLNDYQFINIPDRLFQPVDTEIPGIFACGFCQEPQDIPDSVVQASAAAARAAEFISRED
jgi:heterodisulfide reductase subunit A-like polyferredoxin